MAIDLHVARAVVRVLEKAASADHEAEKARTEEKEHYGSGNETRRLLRDAAKAEAESFEALAASLRQIAGSAK